MGLIFRTKTLIYQRQAYLDVNILFGNTIHLVDPEIRKMLKKGMFGNQDSTFQSGPSFTYQSNENSFL